MMRLQRWTQPAVLALSVSGCGALDDELPLIAPLAAESGRAAAPPAALALDPIERALQSMPARAPCPESYCKIDPRPRADNIHWISASSGEHMWISWKGTQAMYLDGRSLRTVRTAPFSHVVTAGPDSTWATGQNAVGRWDGQAFISYTVPGAVSVRPVDASHVYVGTSDRGLFAWTGAAFTRVPAVDGSRYLTSSGPDDVWAAGDSTLWHYDGKTWREVEEMRARPAEHIVAFAPNDVWVASAKSLFHFDGVAWARRHLGTEFIRGLAGSSSSNLWILGFDNLTHFDGSTFRLGPKMPHIVDSIEAVGDAIYAVDRIGRVSRLEARPEFDVRLIPVTAAAMRSVWASSPTDVWAVGEGGSIWNSDGKTVRAIATSASDRLHDVGGTGPDDVWIVGERGVVLHGSRAGFRALDSGVTAALFAVFAAAPGDVWIGGNDVLLHATQAGIERISVPWNKATWVRDIHGVAPNDLWALGYGEAWHFDGKSWSAPFPLPSYPTNLWALGPNDVWAASDGCGHGACPIAHWDGTRWTGGMISPPAETWMFPLYDSDPRSVRIWALGRDDHWVIDRSGEVFVKMKKP